ncbi:hypothetical protein ACFVYG_05045 [Streptomyces sp. NPDC058256]|uniref:hypothetical protein n=1 Tax=Streptomyces sp. NPDC058256 TaxID=3346408 RepID=UPI0036E19B3A
MRRKIQLGEGESERVACASASAFRGLDTVTGEVLDAGVLGQWVGWLTVLVETMCTAVTEAHFNRSDLAQLASGRDRSGVRLPSNAWMALRTLGWAATVPEGLYVPDRVRRIAEEQAGRALRSVWWRFQVTDAVLATWPAGNPDPLRRTEREWEALRAACPDGQGIAASVLRSRTRQIAAFLTARGRFPADLCELEAAPGGGRRPATKCLRTTPDSLGCAWLAVSGRYPGAPRRVQSLVPPRAWTDPAVRRHRDRRSRTRAHRTRTD